MANRTPPDREHEILTAVRTGDEAGLTREAVAASLGMSPPALSHFLAVRGLANIKTHRDGQPLAAKIVRLCRERKASLDALSHDLGTTAGHLRKIATGKRGASGSLVRSMMLHLYGWSYDTTAEQMEELATRRKEIDALERAEDRRIAAIAAEGTKARSRERAMIDAIDDSVTPADVADRRYHGN